MENPLSLWHFYLRNKRKVLPVIGILALFFASMALDGLHSTFTDLGLVHVSVAAVAGRGELGSEQKVPHLPRSTPAATALARARFA